MPNEKKTLPSITLKNARPPYDEQDGDDRYFRRSAENPSATMPVGDCDDRQP
jgi:hypothetical protein